MKNLLSNTYHRVSFALSRMNRVHQIIFIILTLGMIVGAIGSFVYVIKTHTTFIPTPGGSFTEGIIGIPRFINPVLATSTVDKDLTNLVYAGLIKKSADGYTPELADSYEISDDGRVYTFTLNPEATFHDGVPITADDVAFTISTIQDNTIKSPLRPEWLGVEVSSIDEHTITFTLERPYAGFLQNATVGILPEHIWGALPADQIAFSELNIHPIGSGPYHIATVRKNKLGITSSIKLKRFRKYVGGTPIIKRITIDMFSTFDDLVRAYRKNSIDSFASNNPTAVATAIDMDHPKTIVQRAPLPRVFALFFNQNNNDSFLGEDVVRAIETAIPRQALINNVRAGFGTPICGPLPPTAVGYQPCPEDERLQETRVTDARELLTETGWMYNENNQTLMRNGELLRFTISTVDNDELKKTATFIQDVLGDVGIEVTLQIFEPGNFDQDVLRSRNYEALLFGHVIEHDTDLAALWHSDGRNDPGLNIGVYTNSAVDELVRTAVRTVDDTERAEIYNELYAIFAETYPAVFLYTPDLLYVHDRRLHTQDISILNQYADRFNTIHTWYRYTDRTWKK